MEKDFHYYLTYALAAEARLQKPDVIAYASQFVDDNNEGQFTVDKTQVSFPAQLKANGGYYYPIMTQSLSPKSLDPYVQKYVYVPFHFLPGDDSVAIKERKNPLNTTPNSANARQLLSEALRSNNAYQIGIALHTFADTWSHQNFTGLREEWNAVYPWYSVFKSIVPNIGHAEVGHAPDIISETWTDYRTKERIDNRRRALDAVVTIYSALSANAPNAPTWDSIEKDFKGFISEKDYDKRIKKIVSYLKARHGIAVDKYDENRWISAALEVTGTEVVVKPHFETTDWYRFQQAAKNHFALVMSLIKHIL
jgi:hypothetical protein